jgi:predicted enzyme related to lactoylglutathione lyase
MSGQVSVSIDVDDIEQAVSFYTDALECGAKSVYSDQWVVLQCGGLDIHLLKKEVGTLGAGGEQRHFGRHWTPVHLDFGVDDIDEAMQRVKRSGGSVDDFAHSEAADIAHCADPFGNGFCVIRE